MCLYLVHLQNHHILPQEALHELMARSLTVVLVSMIFQVVPFPQVMQFLYGKAVKEIQIIITVLHFLYFEWFQFFTSLTWINLQPNNTNYNFHNPDEILLFSTCFPVS